MTVPALFENRIEYFVDRRRVLLWIAILVLSVAILIAALFHLDGLSSLDNRIAASIVLTGIVMLTGKAVTLCVGLFRWPGAVLTIDGHGVTDKRLRSEPISWDEIRDIRLLDDWGYQIALDIDAGLTPNDAGRPVPALFGSRDHRSGNPIIQTYFLRTTGRSRMLDFLLPMTTMAPIDFNLVIPTQDVLDTDRAVNRAHWEAIAAFILFAVVIPGIAATYLAVS
jgi:hypothetical protein